MDEFPTTPSGMSVSEHGVVIETHDDTPMAGGGIIVNGIRFGHVDDLGDGSDGVAIMPLQNGEPISSLWLFIPRHLATEIADMLAATLEAGTRPDERGEV